MKYSLIAAALLLTATAHAQTWDVHISMGASSGRLLPTTISMPDGADMKYSWGSPSPYVGAELRTVVSPHSSFGLGYQYSSSKYGISHTQVGSRIVSYDGISLHNISGAYYWQTGVFRNHLRVGAYVQLGLAYGSFTSMGMSGSSYGSMGGFSASNVERLTEFENIPNFWMPNTTLGFTMAPNAVGKKLADRLTFHASVTMGWTEIYKAPSSYRYEILTDAGLERGVVEYAGVPMMIQFGVNYRLFRLGGKPYEAFDDN